MQIKLHSFYLVIPSIIPHGFYLLKGLVIFSYII